MKQWPFATVSKKNERQVAMALACDRSVYRSIGHTKRRKKAACDRSIVFWIDRLQKKTEEEARGQMK